MKDVEVILSWFNGKKFCLNEVGGYLDWLDYWLGGFVSFDKAPEGCYYSKGQECKVEKLEQEFALWFVDLMKVKGWTIAIGHHQLKRALEYLRKECVAGRSNYEGDEQNS